ncbi:hypothetical protein HUU05_03570 [candidate division KSB1 bacterium]|nr:hypothetical protein [candidate division KSB1 bacterium]
MAETQTNSSGNAINVFSGLGMGLLVGIIVGLSVSPVVSVILGALASLLAAFLGLQESGGAAATAEGLMSKLKVNGMRIGSFGFACVAGILLGLFFRSSDLFSDSIQEEVAKWTKAGYTPAEARQFVAWKKLGIQPEGRQVQISEVQKAQSSSLFGTLADLDLCNKISLERLGNDPAEVLRVYRGLYKPEIQDEKNLLYQKLGALADKIERLPVEQQIETLKAVEEVLCELQRLEK